MSLKPKDRSLRAYARKVAQHGKTGRRRGQPEGWPRTWAEREGEERNEHAARLVAPILRTCWHHGARVTLRQ